MASEAAGRDSPSTSAGASTLSPPQLLRASLAWAAQARGARDSGPRATMARRTPPHSLERCRRHSRPRRRAPSLPMGVHLVGEVAMCRRRRGSAAAEPPASLPGRRPASPSASMRAALATRRSARARLDRLALPLNPSTTSWARRRPFLGLARASVSGCASQHRQLESGGGWAKGGRGSVTEAGWRRCMECGRGGETLGGWRAARE